MKLATFTEKGSTRIGVVIEDSIVDLAGSGAGFAARDDRVSERRRVGAGSCARRREEFVESAGADQRETRGANRAPRRSSSRSGSITRITSPNPR